MSAGETIVFAGTNAVLNLADPAGFAGTIQGQGPTDQVNTPRTLVWTGAQNTDFANAFNWDDLTTPANPATAPPDVLDTAEFRATGGTVTGTGTVAVLQFGSLGQWALGSGAALTAETGITVGNGMLAVDGGASIASEGSVDVISGTGGLGAVGRGVRHGCNLEQRGQPDRRRRRARQPGDRGGRHGRQQRRHDRQPVRRRAAPR